MLIDTPDSHSIEQSMLWLFFLVSTFNLCTVLESVASE